MLDGQRRWWRAPVRWAAAAVLTLLLVPAVAVPAVAHAGLVEVTPQAGAQLDDVPRQVRLRFSEPVTITEGSIAVLGPDGQPVRTGRPYHPAAAAGGGTDARAVAVDLVTELGPAPYAVVWKVTSADSHPVSGTFSFGVGVPAGAPPPVPGVDAVVAAVHAGLRLLALLAAALLVGAGAFLLRLWPQGAERAGPRRLVAAGWWGSLLAALGLFAVQGPYGAGAGLGRAADPELLAATLGSGFGRGTEVRVAALLLAAAGWGWLRHRPGTLRSGGFGVLALAFGVGFALAGHDGQGPAAPLTVASDGVHLLAASVWLGGLAVLALGLRPGGGVPVAVLPRWSRTAQLAVAVLVLTGAVQAWRQVGEWPALTGTRYGALLLAKLAGLLVLLALAAPAARWVARHRDATPAPDPAPASGPASGPAPAGLARLRLGVLAEVGVGVAVLALTTALVATVPGREGYAPPFAATLSARDVDGRAIRVEVEIPATRVGAQVLHVYAYTAAGGPLPVAGISGTLRERERGLGPIEVPFRVVAPGHGEASGVVLPASGTWTLAVQVRTDATTSYAAAVGYPVR